ncbi:MAG: MgtC/SapB family protein [Planctomycetota bacterium]
MSLEIDLFIHALVAAGCGAVIGIEREISGHEAGLRTTIAISIGACVFASMGVYLTDANAAAGGGVQIDPSRMASYVVAGIGFLGAGAIMRHGGQMRGLTTAATVWVAAAAGVCAGVGAYLLAVAVSTLILIVLRGLRPVGKWLSGPLPEQRVQVILPDDPLQRRCVHHLVGEYSAIIEHRDRASEHEPQIADIRYSSNHRSSIEFLGRLSEMVEAAPNEDPHASVRPSPACESADNDG